MSRRDTIIIALLINAGLLALLFMLAINTDDEKVSDQPASAAAVVENRPAPVAEAAPMPVIMTNASVVDEVDNFLKEMPPEELSQPILVDDEGFVELEKEKPIAIHASTAVASADQSSDELRYVEVTVKRGDALEKIARANGTTVEAIKKANNLNTAKLSIGQVLRVPANKKNSSENSAVKSSKTAAINKPIAASKETAKAVSGKGDPQYYTIKNGDSPWKIAKEFQLDLEDLLLLNGLDEAKARNMKVGEKIRVR